jgi:hypothetical protein
VHIALVVYLCDGGDGLRDVVSGRRRRSVSKITTEMTIEAHSPDNIVCVWALEVVSIDAFQVRVRFNEQEMTLYTGNTLEMRASILRRDIAAMSSASLLEKLETLVGEAKQKAGVKGWFFNKGQP